MRIEPGHKLHDRWRIDRLLGEGGMGYVLEGYDEFLGRRVAIKTLQPRLSADARIHDRFLSEARAMARVDHTNVVRILEVFDWNGLPVMAMEFVEGEPLTKTLERDPCPPLHVVRAVAHGVLRALHAAHKSGIVHRDIKPDNIMLTFDETGEVHAKVLDFGVARVSDEVRHTQTGTAVGTVRYMSPEQLRDSSRIDHRSDLFSLGVVLWEMLYGHRPWSWLDGDEFEMRVAIVREQLPPLPPRVPGELRELVEALLQKDPAARPQDAKSALQALGGGSSSSRSDAQRLSGSTSQLSAQGGARGYAPPPVGAPPLWIPPQDQPIVPWEDPNSLGYRGASTSGEVGFGSMASVWQRFAGLCVDALAAGGVMIVGMVLAGLMLGNEDAGLVLLIPYLILQAVLITLRGQSIGKIVMKTRIVLVDGSPCGFGRGVLLRWWLPAFLGGLFGAGGLPGLYGLFSLVNAAFILSDDRRLLHDRIAGTRVINVREDAWT